MNSAPTTFRPSGPDASELPTRQEMVAWIDASFGTPVLSLLGGALVWLLLGTFSLFISSLQLHLPSLLAHCPVLTYGRLQPASVHALLYGFASQAALAIGLWLLGRLGRTRMMGGGFAAVGALFWNVAVLLGFLGILAGQTTGVLWLEMPWFAGPVLFFAYVLLGICALMTFQARSESSLYPAQWFVLLGLFAFPWLFSVAEMLLVISPVRGVAQLSVGGWFRSGLWNLWLTPLALASLFYFIPKLVARPLHSRGLAILSFWLLALLGAVGGVHAGAPVPNWISSLSISGSIVLLLVVLAVVMNLFHTMQGAYEVARRSEPTLPFFRAALVCYAVAALAGGVVMLPRLSRTLHFSLVPEAIWQVGLFGFLALAFAGSAYYIVERVTGRVLFSAGWGRFHLLGTLLGLTISAVALAVGGLLQGQGLNNPDKELVEVTRGTVAFLRLSSLGLALVLAAQFAFCGQFVLLGRGWCRACCGGKSPEKPRRVGKNGKARS